MRRSIIVVGVAASILSGSISTAAAFGGLRSAAKSFSRAAQKEGVVRLAVLPFRPMDGSSLIEGVRLSERLMTKMAGNGRVDIVERMLLQGLIDEQWLGSTGVFDAQQLGRLGRMLQAQAVVTGTFARDGERVEVHARLVHLETGVILVAKSMRLKRYDYPAAGGVIPDRKVLNGMQDFRKNISLNFKEAKQPQSPSWKIDASDLRDSAGDIGDETCLGAARRIDALQEKILALKARYWAEEVKKAGISGEQINIRPGALIQNPVLRNRFQRMFESAVKKNAPPLSRSEANRFMKIDSEAFLLSIRCPLNGKKF